MRLIVLSLFAIAGSLYAYAAFDSYREELSARSSVPLEALSSKAEYQHPEANLRRVRDKIAAEEYTDELKPYLERALHQAPSFYQPSFLVAAFYANRLEQPDLIERAFEEAIARFPSNGRLHLTYAEWMLTPRATAPYRAYRAFEGDALVVRRRALDHIASATRLEPDLDRRAVDLLVRFQVPLSEWAAVLPSGEATMRAVLSAVNRMPRDRAIRRSLLEKHLSATNDVLTLRLVERYAGEWGERALALSAAEKWRIMALERGFGTEITRATLRVAHHLLERGEADRAYGIVRETLEELAARRLSEDSVDLLIGMASTYLARRRIAMAESLYTEAATLSPHRAQVHLGLARAHQLAGEHGAAIGALERVLEIDPGNREAKTMLERISDSRGDR